jgi:hypothetical protein
MLFINVEGMTGPMLLNRFTILVGLGPNGTVVCLVNSSTCVAMAGGMALVIPLSAKIVA